MNYNRVIKKLVFKKRDFSKPLRVLSTYPRSGTHWLKNMISYVMGKRALDERLLEESKLISAMENKASQCLIYDHFDYDLHASVLNPNRYPNLKMVLLIRHPLDTLISNFYRRGYIGGLPDSKLSPMENMKLFLRGYWNDKLISEKIKSTRLFSMSYGEYVRRCAVDWIKTRYCFTVRYEDMVADTFKQLTLILNYLNVPHSPEIVSKAVEQKSFKKLSEGRSVGEEDVNSHYRKGVVGEWREVFDQEDLEIIRNEIGDNLEILGYSID